MCITFLVEASSDHQVIKSEEKAADSKLKSKCGKYLSSPCCQVPCSVFCRLLVKMQDADTGGNWRNRRNCRVLKIVEGKSEKLLLMTFAASPLVFYFMVQPCSLQLDCGGF
jgi:hypothetical protein